MKFINLLILIIVIFAAEWVILVKSSYYGSFEVTECVKMGEVCNGRFSFCRGGSCQNPNTTLEGFKVKICSRFKKYNESCINIEDCERGLYCRRRDMDREYVDSDFENAFCLDAQFASFGESCDNNVDCLGTLKCINSKCTNVTLDCKEEHECESEHYCNGGNCDAPNLLLSGSEPQVETNCSDSRCVPTLGKGRYCVYQSDCSLGLVCGNENLCVEKFSAQLGDSCKDGYFQVDQCDISKSLVCLDGKCAKRNESTTNNCLKDECKFNGELCDAKTGKCVDYDKVFSEKCILAEKNRNLCLIKNKCSFVNGDNVNFGRRSCQMKYCSNQILEYSKQCSGWDKLQHSCNQN